MHRSLRGDSGSDAKKTLEEPPSPPNKEEALFRFVPRTSSTESHSLAQREMSSHNRTDLALCESH